MHIFGEITKIFALQERIERQVQLMKTGIYLEDLYNKYQSALLEMGVTLVHDREELIEHLLRNPEDREKHTELAMLSGQLEGHKNALICFSEIILSLAKQRLASSSEEGREKVYS